MSDDIIVKIVEVETISVNITEETPIIVNIDDKVSTLLSDVFIPDEDGLKITKIYIKDGKLKVKYEDGE